MQAGAQGLAAQVRGRLEAPVEESNAVRDGECARVVGIRGLEANKRGEVAEEEVAEDRRL